MTAAIDPSRISKVKARDLGIAHMDLIVRTPKGETGYLLGVGRSAHQDVVLYLTPAVAQRTVWLDADLEIEVLDAPTVRTPVAHFGGAR